MIEIDVATPKWAKAAISAIFAGEPFRLIAHGRRAMRVWRYLEVMAKYSIHRPVKVPIRYFFVVLRQLDLHFVYCAALAKHLKVSMSFPNADTLVATFT